METQLPRSHSDSVLKARIIQWNAKKGYGFLQVGKERVFLHRRDFIDHFKKPEFGDRIRFTLGEDEKGRTCAQNAVHDSRAAGISIGAVFGFPTLLLLPLAGMVEFGLDFNITAACLVVINALTYWVYARDKAAARRGGRRTPEIQLHLLEFLGGWPAAFFAQRKLPHKNCKAIYQVVFWTIILSHQLIALDYLRRWEFSRKVLDLLQSLSIGNFV